MNELVFLLHLLCVSIASLVVLRMGYEALCAFLCVQAILANLFVIKQISLCGFNATAADIYVVGSVFTLNLMQEYYGFKHARKAVWISFCLLIFYTIVSQIHIWYIPSFADFSQSHYYQLLSYMPRLATASIVVYLLVQYFDTYFYALIKNFFKGKYIIVRNIISITISQFLDTILFSFLGLYGIVENIAHIILISFLVKLIALLLLSPFVLSLQNWIQKN